MWLSFIVYFAFLILPHSLPAASVELEQEAHRIASELRCAVCQNLSVADSPSELAQQMRDVILAKLKQGESPEQIKAFFVSKYGEWVLLSPPPKGLNLLIWVLPFVAVVLGIVFVVFMTRRWAGRKKRADGGTIDPAVLTQIQKEIAGEEWEEVEPPVSGHQDPRKVLLQKRARLYADLKELAFDYQAGRLSKDDYAELSTDLEIQAATVLKELESTPPLPGVSETAPSEDRAEEQGKKSALKHTSYPALKLTLGGAFLLLFGVTLGVFLTNSLKPRGSESESITGDFLTGTGPSGTGREASNSLVSLVAEGRVAFEQRRWASAIESFKKALAIDANHAEALVYMGLILTEAGHGDGAIQAFDRALASNPNFPLALWGKGLVLFFEQKDYASARKLWEKLLSTLPDGEDREAVQKLIADAKRLERGGTVPAATVEQQPAPNVAKHGRLSGTIFLSPAVENKAASTDTLFIIVRRGMAAGGPPAAVKKITSPKFPLKFSLGPENSMIPGTPFEGKMSVTVRLDKDGNAATRNPGDLGGAYKNNPATVGQSDIEITIDQLL